MLEPHALVTFTRIGGTAPKRVLPPGAVEPKVGAIVLLGSRGAWGDEVRLAPALHMVPVDFWWSHAPGVMTRAIRAHLGDRTDIGGGGYIPSAKPRHTRMTDAEWDADMVSDREYLLSDQGAKEVCLSAAFIWAKCRCTERASAAGSSVWKHRAERWAKQLIADLDDNYRRERPNAPSPFFNGNPHVGYVSSGAVCLACEMLGIPVWRDTRDGNRDGYPHLAAATP